MPTKSRGYSTALVPCTALAVAAGCAIDSVAVLRELDAIERQKRSGDFLRSLTSISRFAELAEAVQARSEDVVTEAYMGAATDEQRAMVAAIADYNNDGSGRYIPLLCYALQFARDPNVRMRAAKGLARPERLNPVLSKSSIVLLLGRAFAEEPVPHRVERLAYYLEEFLRKACGFAIPGAERRECRMALNASARATVRVVRSDPAVIREWWVESGQEMALRRTFDEP